MAITPAVAILISSAVAGVGTAASILLQPKPPKPTPPPDPALARKAELDRLASADTVQARAVRTQNQYDSQFIRESGLKL